MVVRQLAAQHAQLAAPLILSSGEASLRAMFDRSDELTALGFLQHSLVYPVGQFGFKRHWGLFDDNSLIGTGSCWTSHITQSFKQATLDGLVDYYGWDMTHLVLDSSALIAEIIPSLNQDELGVGHLAIVAEHRGNGHVRQLLDFFDARARGLGKTALVLDVEAHNTGAIQAYSRYGFEQVQRYAPSGAGKSIGLGPHLHMRRLIGPAAV